MITPNYNINENPKMITFADILLKKDNTQCFKNIRCTMKNYNILYTQNDIILYTQK